MRTTIGISGPAGLGVVSAGILICEILSEMGYYVIGDKEYSSVVKGGNNLFTISISDKDYYFDKKLEHYFYFNDYALTTNSKDYDIENLYKIDKNLCNYQNTYSIGLIGILLGIPEDKIIEKIQTIYKSETLQSNLNDIQNAYKSNFKQAYKIENIGKKHLYFGNEIIGKGAISSGLSFYSAYPMTPASSLIDVIIKDENIIFYQGEDEIAVAMGMLGAKFAGARAMCGTSGGGFALMSESISFSNQAEIGGVYILSQRAGPSTGTPTFTEQSDLNFAINASFGDTYPIVIAPGNFEDGYNLIGKALNWSDIYQHPIVVLLDKTYSESYVSINEKSLKSEEINRGKIESNPGDGFARYTNTQDGISPYTLPGMENGEFIASSYEHDEYGASIEDSKYKVMMTNKRLKKLDTFIKNEFNENFDGYEIINEKASKFYITFGFSSYGVKSYIQDKPEYGVIIIKILSPIDIRLNKFFEANYDKIKQLIFVEQNATGQLENTIINKLGMNVEKWKNKIKSIRKYNLYPIYESDLQSSTKQGEII